MSQYQELCGAFAQSADDWNGYRQRSIVFVGNLLAGFVSYLGAPDDRVKFLPPEPRDPDTIYSAMGAAKLEEDGWWVAYVQLTLTRGEGVYPQLPVLFKFGVRVEPDSFAVRIGDSYRRHLIKDGDAAALEAAYQEAQARAKDYFTSGLQRFLDETGKDDQGKTSRKIGFV
jgi:hypothetical protein